MFSSNHKRPEPPIVPVVVQTDRQIELKDRVNVLKNKRTLIQSQLDEVLCEINMCDAEYARQEVVLPYEELISERHQLECNRLVKQYNDAVGSDRNCLYVDKPLDHRVFMCLRARFALSGKTLGTELKDGESARYAPTYDRGEIKPHWDYWYEVTDNNTNPKPIEQQDVCKS